MTIKRKTDADFTNDTLARMRAYDDAHGTDLESRADVMFAMIILSMAVVSVGILICLFCFCFF